MYGLQTPEENIPDPMTAGSSRLVDACSSDLLVSFQNALYIRGLLEKYPTVFFYANT